MGDNRAHSELGASISKRWIACPGSVNLSRGREQADNVHAQAGRVAHAVGEACVREAVDPRQFEDEVVDGVLVDAEMVEAVTIYADYCHSLLAPASSPKHYWIEYQFDLSSLNPPADMFGTADFVTYDPQTKQLEVVDLKYGQGVLVEVVGNPQLRYYALGAALELGKEVEIDTVKITIVQPRAWHPDGVIRSEVITYGELLDFAGELMDAAAKTIPADAPLVAGEHCRFCPAAAVCPEQRQQVQALAQTAFEAMPVMAPPVPETLPDDVFNDMMGKLSILTDWASAMQAEQTRRLLQGQESPHFKLVEKRPVRKWAIDEEELAQLLIQQGVFEEEIYNRKIKSPAQIEKLVGKKKLPAELVKKESSGYKLAPITDPRPALAPSPGDAFAALPPADE